MKELLTKLCFFKKVRSNYDKEHVTTYIRSAKNIVKTNIKDIILGTNTHNFKNMNNMNSSIKGTINVNLIIFNS